MPSPDEGAIFDIIYDAVGEIHLAANKPWNVAHIAWRQGDAVAAIETNFDPTIVPRAPDDPVYEKAAVARRLFWNSVGKPASGYLGDAEKANSYGQTRWFAPHRRLLQVEVGGRVLLATDGLSTPPSGVADKVNGCKIEVFLKIPDGQAEVEPWINVLLDIGDMIVDDISIESDVLNNGAIVFCALHKSVEPFSHIVLGVPTDDEPKNIISLPYGDARLLKATPVTTDDFAGRSLEGLAVEAAHHALANRESKSGG